MLRFQRSNYRPHDCQWYSIPVLHQPYLRHEPLALRKVHHIRLSPRLNGLQILLSVERELIYRQFCITIQRMESFMKKLFTNYYFAA